MKINTLIQTLTLKYFLNKTVYDKFFQKTKPAKNFAGFLKFTI